jgi:hypothetical protein
MRKKTTSDLDFAIGPGPKTIGFRCDLAFSTPKSVSTFWARATPALRQKVEEAHQRAVKAALLYLEETAG